MQSNEFYWMGLLPGSHDKTGTIVNW